MISKKESLILISSIFVVSFFSAKLNLPWMWPVIDAFPAVERLLDPNFLINDFTTNTFNDFSARHYISSFFVLGSQLFDVHYTIFVEWANIARIFCVGVVSYFFFDAISKNKTVTFVSFYLASISLFGWYGFIPTTPAWGFMGPMLDGHNFAVLFILLSWTMVIHHHINWGILSLIPAMIIHPVVTIHAAIISLVIYFSFYSTKTITDVFKDWKIYISFVLFILAFLINYIPFKEALSGFEGLADEEFIYILAYFRHPYHYIPSQFHTDEWLKFGGYIATFIYMFYRVRDLIPKKIFIYIPIYLGIIMIMGYFFVEVIPLKFVISIIPYRSLMVFVPIFILLYAYFMVYKFNQGDYLSFIILHIPFTFVLQHTIGLKEYSQWILLICFLYILLTDLFQLKLERINSTFKVIFTRFSLYKMVLCVFIIIDLWIIGRFTFRSYLSTLPIRIPTLESKHLLDNKIIYSWLHQNTPEDSIILAERAAAKNRFIRLIARRAIVVDYEFPFLEKYYREWYERYTDTYGNDLKIGSGHIDKASETHLNRISYKYGVNFVLRTQPITSPVSFKLVQRLEDLDFEQNPIIIYVYQHIKSSSEV